MKTSRRNFLIGAVALGAGALSYARLLEPQWLEVRRVRVPAPGPGLRRPLRILQLSDLHWSHVVPLSLISRAVELGLAEKPDLVCLTGDYTTVGDPRPTDELEAALRPLTRSVQAIAVMGNHDGGIWSRSHGGEPDVRKTASMLERAGFKALHNEITMADVDAGRIAIAGAADMWSGQFNASDLDRAMKSVAADLHILLAHNPDSKDRAPEVQWDLMLSGHTHGGQFVIPVVGPPIVPVRDRRYVAGLHRWRDRWVYTTRGVGNLYGLRVNCRPEVTLLEIG